MVLSGVNPALDAEFGRAPGHGIARLLEQRFERVIVGVILIAMAREAAERAPHVADVGEIDVADHHERDVVAVVFAAGEIRGAKQRKEVGSLDGQQHRRITLAEFALFESRFENAADLRAHAGEQALQHHAASTP